MIQGNGTYLIALVAIAALTAATARAETPLERGTYLMNSIVACGNCHTLQTPQGPAPGMELAGGLKIDEPGVFTAIAPNITPDAETGIGKWTDRQLITAIREGKRPDGSIMGPPMPFHLYRHVSDEDMAAIIAYLRAAKPVSNKVQKSEYKIPLPPSYGPPVTGAVAAVPKSDQVAYGGYLAGPLGHCIDCHSTPGPNGAADLVNKLGGGGFVFHGPWGQSVAPNITPNAIGKLSDDQLRKIITTGVRPDGTRLLPPMGVYYYKNISTDDLSAIVAYLRSLKAL